MTLIGLGIFITVSKIIWGRGDYTLFETSCEYITISERKIFKKKNF